MVIGPVAHPPLGKLGAPAERSGALVTALVKLSPKTGSRFTLYETKARIDAPAPLQLIHRECCVKLRPRLAPRAAADPNNPAGFSCPLFCGELAESEEQHYQLLDQGMETEEEGRAAGVVAAVGRGVQQRALQLDRSWSTSRRSWWRTPKPRQRTRRAPPSKWRGSPSRKSAVGLATSRQDLSPKEIKKVTQRATLA